MPEQNLPYPGQDQPLISVLMPVYNSAPYVAEAIRSIQQQSYTRWEFIIADDGSTDDSAAIIAACAAADPRIRPLFLPHGGEGRAMNAAVAAARGDLIARMDSDDVALPQRLSSQLDWMRQTGVDICGSCGMMFGAGDGLWWVPEEHEAISYALLFGLAVLHPTVLMRPEILRAHPYEQGAADDYELWTRLAPLYRIGNVPLALVKLRQHAAQVHVLRAAECRAEMSVARRRLIAGLFPAAAPAERELLARVCEGDRLRSLAELDAAGHWLARLAGAPDPHLRRLLAKRWLRICRAAAHFGPATYRTYRRFAPAIGVDADENAVKILRLSCLLRLRNGSRLQLALSWTRNRFVPGLLAG